MWTGLKKASGPSVRMTGSGYTDASVFLIWLQHILASAYSCCTDNRLVSVWKPWDTVHSMPQSHTIITHRGVTIDHLYTWLRTTSNYRATANFHSSQITTAPAKPFPAFCVFTSRPLLTASNTGDSSASSAQVLSSQPTIQNSTELNWVWVWVLCYDRRSTGQSVLEWSTQLGLTTRSLLLVWQLRSCSCGAPSLTRGRVCLLYVLLALASAVFLGSESLGTWGHILLSQIWGFPFRRLLQLAGSRWRYSTPSPHGSGLN
jgi:hypothetical protein